MGRYANTGVTRTDTVRWYVLRQPTVPHCLRFLSYALVLCTLPRQFCVFSNRMTSRAARIIASLLERYMASGRANKNKKHRAKVTAIWNTRLPKVRVFPDNTVMTNISTQPQALFFSKLPLELRGLIYSYAFCNSSDELELQVAKDKVGGSQFQPFELSCPTAQQLFGFPSSCKLSYVLFYTT